MITADEYATITGSLAPADFDTCEALACEMLHAYTLYAYVGREIDKMPAFVQASWKRAVALQTQAISQQGGVDGLADIGFDSVSLGGFSYSGGGDETPLSPAVGLLLPMLIAYGRGLGKCDPSPCGCSYTPPN